jgi:hypothetical protein
MEIVEIIMLVVMNLFIGNDKDDFENDKIPQ